MLSLQEIAPIYASLANDPFLNNKQDFLLTYKAYTYGMAKICQVLKNIRLIIRGSILLLFLMLLVFHTTLGIVVWNITHIPEVSLFLNQDAKFALEIGNYYFNVYKNGVYDLKKASYYFNHALALDPHVPDAWHQLARFDFLRGDFPNALIKINKQIELHGNSFMASYYIRGLVNGFLGNTRAAEQDFKTFLAWDTKNWAAHNDLAWIYFTQGDYSRTEEIARKGLASNPHNPWLLTSLGVALLNQDKKKEAKIALQEAHQESQKLTETDWNRAYPGNDPMLGKHGVKKMQEIIERNLALAD